MTSRPGQIETIPSPPSATKVLSLLANEVRIEVLTALGSAEKSVGSIAEELGLEPSTISHALRSLSKAGLVTHTVVRKQHIYRLTARVSTTFQDSASQIEILTSAGRVLVEIRLPERL